MRVRRIVADSLCVDVNTVQLESSLVRDLGAESIDFLDIVFRLEKEFDIRIPQREIERMARGGLEPAEFEVDGIIQEKGLTRLRELLPEIDPSAFRSGLTLRELPGLFTVHVFVGIVQRKLDKSWDSVGTDGGNADSFVGRGPQTGAEAPRV